MDDDQRPPERERASRARPKTPRPREHLRNELHVETTTFLHQIIATAEALKEARDFAGNPALHLDTTMRILRAIERCGGAPTFSDLGRLLGMSRQAAREQALTAAASGVVELFQAPDDRRAWQVMLTPRGRRELEARRMPQLAWIFALLSGLESPVMRTTTHVLRVVARRLERYERERRRTALALSSASARR